MSEAMLEPAGGEMEGVFLFEMLEDGLSHIERTRFKKPEAYDYYLVFNASQNEPDFMGIFMENGGQINAAATKWETDFASSAAHASTVSSLDDVPREVRVPIATHKIMEGEVHGKQAVRISSSFRLNISTSRIGASINGTLVSSVAGQGSAFLFDILRTSKSGHSQIGLVYASWLAHGASIGISSPRIVGVNKAMPSEEISPPVIQFAGRSDQMKMILSGAAKIVQQYVQISYSTRQQIVYAPSPMLTKAVFKEPVGVDGQGYSLVHDILDRGSPIGLKTLNNLFKAAIAVDALQDKTDIKRFETVTRNPSLEAAKEAGAVASAVSIMVNYLVAYRADGRNMVSVMGADFAPAESWLRQVARDPIEANDCDGSALMAIGMINAASQLTVKQYEDPGFSYLRSVRNAVCPYYQVALSVVGATAAEANSADAETEHVAGHAIAVMIPSINLLRSMGKGVYKQIGKTKNPVCSPQARELVKEERFRALFPAQGTLETQFRLPPEEVEKLGTWGVAEAHVEFDDLLPWAIEGTTPTSPVMYVPDAAKRAKIEGRVKREDIALAKASPNVFRSVKILHVGGSSAGSTHRFYRDFVEFTFSRKSPLYTNSRLRQLNAAASQFVLSRDTPADELESAGATPKDVVMQDYIMVPLVAVNDQSGAILDIASDVAAQDVMPDRGGGPMVLTPFQTENLKRSHDSLKALHERMKDKEQHGQCVLYEVAYSTLVHNPSGVEHFVKTMENVGTKGHVDFATIEGLAIRADGSQAGVFATVNVYIPR